MSFSWQLCVGRAEDQAVLLAKLLVMLIIGHCAIRPQDIRDLAKNAEAWGIVQNVLSTG
jgi:hypothetical protein